MREASGESRLIVRVKLAALVTALAGALAMTLASCPAGAHGEADWISKGGFKTAAGTTCCTEKDCGIIYPRAVEWEADTVRSKAGAML